MGTFLERYQAGEHVAVWDDLMALGETVRREPYSADATAVAAETMRRARHNVELLIRRLDARGYRFLDTVSSARNSVSQLDVISLLAGQVEAFAAQNPASQTGHSLKILEGIRSMQSKMGPLLQKAAGKASQKAAAPRKPPLEDPLVFQPPDKNTHRQLANLEAAIGGPLPLSLRAWYEQVGGVSLMGSDAELNAVDFSNRNVLLQFNPLTSQSAAPTPQPAGDYAPDPLVVFPLESLLEERECEEDEDGDGSPLQLTISPDDLHKANVSGDAYYITLPDARADFPFDDWHHTTFVNYLRIAFKWGGFPGWERSPNPPRQALAELADGLLPL